MRSSKARAMTWTLVALGVVMIALAGVLVATLPAQRGWMMGGVPWAAPPWAGAPQAGGQPGDAQPGAPQGGPQGTAPQGAPQGAPQAGVPPAFNYGPMYAWHGWHHPWYGYGYGYRPWGFFHGPRFFGGGFLFLVLIVVGIAFLVRRRRGWHYRRWDDSADAEEILRRTFAEGRITEEEYKSRLAALGK